MDSSEPAQTMIPSAPALAGKTLAGEFRIVRLLGQGGMGAVYLGHQVSLDRPVAIKLLPPEATAEAGAVARFQREAIAAGKLQHPNIVQVYWFGQQDGRWFIAMEFVEGETLAALLARKQRLGVAEALTVVREVARALAAAHEQGFIHRDVKPDNVFLGKNGRVKLGDFGLARDTRVDGGLSAAGQVMGTPYYMPPEQCRGEKADARADLYSLGATLYHLMTGLPPYRGKSAIDILAQQISAPVPPSESFGPDVPPAGVELVRRMMAKAPADRPESAQEVIEAIDGLLATGAAGTRGGAEGTGAGAAGTLDGGPGTRVGAAGALSAVASPVAGSAAAFGGAKTVNRPSFAGTVPSPAPVGEPPPPARSPRSRLAVVAAVALVVVVAAFGWARLRRPAPRDVASPDSLGAAPTNAPDVAPTNAPTTAPDPVPAVAKEPQPGPGNAPVANPPADPKAKTPPVAPDPTPTGAPGADRMLAKVRQALAGERYGEALHMLDALPAMSRRGPYAQTIRQLREEALTKLLAMIQPRLDEAGKRIAAGQFNEAEAALAPLDVLHVDEVTAKVAALRKELAQARKAAGGK